MRDPYKFEVWRESVELCTSVYKLTVNYPELEKFSLVNQINRSVVSVPSNIAEGCSRSSDREFKRFLEISIGSLFELQTQLLISKNLDYINEGQLINILTHINKIKYQLLALVKILKS